MSALYVQDHSLYIRTCVHLCKCHDYLKQFCHSGEDSLTYINKYNVPNNGHTTLQVQFCSSPVPSLCIVPVCVEAMNTLNKGNKN